MDSFTELALSLEVDVTQFTKASQHTFLVELSAPVSLLRDTIPAAAIAEPGSEEPSKAQSAQSTYSSASNSDRPAGFGAYCVIS